MTYAADLIEEETAYLAYHFHWGMDAILDLEHADRQAYVRRLGELVQPSE